MATLSKAMHYTIRNHLDCLKPDAVLNIETHIFNTCIVAHTCKYDLDIGKHVWLNKQRWSRLVREYISKAAVERFITDAQYIFAGNARKGATANMLFNDPVRSEKKHRWGGCLMGATFRGDEDSYPTITFYSRTTYIGYMGLLDAAIAHVMAREIASPKQIAFRWYITSQQLHHFKTLPYIYSQPDLMKKLSKYAKNPRLVSSSASPAWIHITKWYQKVLEAYKLYGTDMLEQEKYGPFRRIKRRWLEYKGYLDKNVPPSLTLDQLTFEKAD